MSESFKLMSGVGVDLRHSVGPLTAIIDLPCISNLAVACCHSALSFVDKNSQSYSWPGCDMFEPSSATLSASLSSLVLVEEFVRLVNTASNGGTSIGLVGCDWWKLALVYQTLVMVHNWQVASVEESIKHFGPNYGSATHWHRYNRTLPVLDWPTRFKLPELDIETLPCERPDWQARLDAEKQQNMLKKQNWQSWST